MAEREETGSELQVSFEESDSDSSFEVIEDPTNPKVSTGFLCMHLAFTYHIEGTDNISFCLSDKKF